MVSPPQTQRPPAGEHERRVEDKLYDVRFKTDEERSHLLILDTQTCADCTDKPCTVFCPVSVYKWENGQAKISVSYEKCVECGACRIGCPYFNIEWTYPKGGFGVQYKFG